MDCNEAKTIISASVDRELIPDRQELVNQHLEVCQTCSKLNLDILTLSSQIRELAAANVADFAFQERIIKSLHSQAERNYFSPLSVFAAVAAAVALIVVVALVLMENDRSSVRSASLDPIEVSNFVAEYKKHTNPAPVPKKKTSQILEQAISVDEKSISKQAGFAVSASKLTGYLPFAVKVLTLSKGDKKVVYWCYQSSKQKNVSCIDCYEFVDGKINAEGFIKKQFASRKVSSGSISGKSVLIVEDERNQSRKVFISALPSKTLLSIVRDGT